MAKKRNLIQYKDDFLRLYNEGKSINEIGRIYNANKGSISRILKSCTTLRDTSPIPGNKDKILELHMKGLTRAEIARTLDITYTTVSNFLVRSGLVKVNSKYEDLIPKFKEDYESGMSLQEIGDKYSVSPSSVHTYLMQEGVDVRDYTESSRKYELNEAYFDNLTNKKAYQLGLIFELANVFKNDGHGSPKISLSTKNNVKCMFKALEGVSSKGEGSINIDTKTGVKVLYINSYGIYNAMVHYGFESDKLNIPTEYMDSFMLGFFETALSITDRRIYISLDKPYVQSILNYLNNLQIRYVNKTKYVAIYNKDGALKLLTKFPDLMDKVAAFLEKKSDSTYWILRKQEFEALVSTGAVK